MRVCLMDLMCTVPYYTGHLCNALKDSPVDTTLASIDYHLDSDYFSREHIRNVAGCTGWSEKLGGATIARRVVKVGEYIVNLAWLAARFARHRPDVLHVQFLPLLRYGVPIEYWFLRFARALGIPVVYTVHNTLPHDTGDRCFKCFDRIYNLADILICHNDAARRELHERFGIQPERIRVVPHGPLFQRGSPVDRDASRLRLDLAPSDSIVLWQGFIKPYKGLGFLLDSWRTVQHHRPDARLLIVGSGEPEALREISEQVQRLDISSSVRFVSRFVSTDELRSYYEASDILVYPYCEITTSGALLTGLNYDKPVIATDLPAFRELLGDTALLVAYGDQEALGRALLRLIDDPFERRRIAEAQRKIQPAWESIAEQTVACYRSAIGAYGPLSGQI